MDFPRQGREFCVVERYTSPTGFLKPCFLLYTPANTQDCILAHEHASSPPSVPCEEMYPGSHNAIIHTVIKNGWMGGPEDIKRDRQREIKRGQSSKSPG